MSSENKVSNPFLALFSCPNDTSKFRELSNHVPSLDVLNKSQITDSMKTELSSSSQNFSKSDDSKCSDASELDEHSLSHVLEDIFRFTISEVPCCSVVQPVALVYLREVHLALEKKIHLDLSCLEQALFERLLLDDALARVVTRKSCVNQDDVDNAAEERIMFYLYLTFRRLTVQKKIKGPELEQVKKIIISQVASCLCCPEMFPEANLHKDLIELIIYYHNETGNADILSCFLTGVASSIVHDKKSDLMEILGSSFSILQEKLKGISIFDRQLYDLIGVLHYFTRSSDLSSALIQYSMPANLESGKDFQNSLLGLPLSISCLPRSEFEEFEFFQEPSRQTAQEHGITEESLWHPLGVVASEMHLLFYNILRQSPATKHMLLEWIGFCLKANSGRAKLWNSQMPEMFGSLHASDGFFINLEAVVLKLCVPFSDPESPKLLNIDPTYTASNFSKEVHLKGLSGETCLIPRNGNEDAEEKTYNFSTECFFATHCALKFGFNVVHEKMVKLNQELVRIQRLYEEVRSQGGNSSEVVVRIKENMEKGMTKFLSYRTVLLVPEILDMMLKFHIATARWLVNLATSNSNPSKFEPVSFPLSSDVSNALSYVPEFVVENVADCVLFIKRFSPKSFEMMGDLLDHLMTMILVFMGSPERVKNPHLRAHLAEMLEALMPYSEGEHSTAVFMPSMYREKLFTSHPFRKELVPILLHVFVSIEMTGQSVAFEQKFQYRRPMYVVLDYLWKNKLYKMKMKEMAEEAERNIESSHPPIFLHFINLLINDAIFLLDEALSCMTKLREIQLARDSGEWSSLSPEQRYQQEGNFHHVSLLAKFHNVMSNETIHTLQWLTTEIKSIFCHPAMIERIAAMLNYFLLHLVGPQKKNLKVKDFKEYEFKPQELVRDICRIYKNLGLDEGADAEAFCLAVSRDGRSYSPDLFPQAQAVLIKIGHGILGTEIDEIAIKIQKLAYRQQEEEEILSEAPEEFLDPIMNTMMKDPVKLPSSGVTIDRSTIARHLLSDQTDPFNRSPLTMDMVKPDHETKEKISKWLQSRFKM